MLIGEFIEASNDEGYRPVLCAGRVAHTGAARAELLVFGCG